MSRMAPPKPGSSSLASQRTELSVPFWPKRRVALTVLPSVIWFLIAAPSVWRTESDGMVTVGSTPPMLMMPLWLLATTRPTAPLAWAFAAFMMKGQFPRSRIAIFPASWAAFTNGVSQPSLGVPAGAGRSRRRSRGRGRR